MVSFPFNVATACIRGCFAFLVSFTTVWAADSAEGNKYNFEYSAKVVCGIQAKHRNMKLVSGRYATSVNIRNPGRDKAEFEKSLALTFPPDEQKAGAVLPMGEGQLGPGEALAVDCVDIKISLFPYGFPKKLIEGFLVIRSNQSLDVTTVYTAAAMRRRQECCCEDKCSSDCCDRKSTPQASIDVEQIRERKIGKDDKDRLADLIPAPPYPLGDPIGAPGTSYCSKARGARFVRDVRVLVRNIGDADVGKTRTRVAFDPGGPSLKDTPALAAGGETALDFEIPTACIVNPACKFTISVDDELAVTESLETNNSAVSLCRTRKEP